MNVTQEDLDQMARQLGLPKIEPGQDAHKLTATQMFGVPYDQVTPEQRSAAKRRNFSLTYYFPEMPS